MEKIITPETSNTDITWFNSSKNIYLFLRTFYTVNQLKTSEKRIHVFTTRSFITNHLKASWNKKAYIDENVLRFLINNFTIHEKFWLWVSGASRKAMYVLHILPAIADTHSYTEWIFPWFSTFLLLIFLTSVWSARRYCGRDEALKIPTVSAEFWYSETSLKDHF